MASAVTGGVAVPPAEAQVSAFAPLEIPLRTDGIRDIGVTDVNNDGHMDVFTVNHSARENILLGRGDGTFQQKIEKLRLVQDPRFPGLIFTGRKLPPPPDGQVHIVWHRTDGKDRFVVRTPNRRATGRFTFFSRVEIATKGGARASSTTRNLWPGVFESQVKLTSVRRGRLEIHVEEVGVPVRVKLDTTAGIRVGLPSLPAGSRTFRLFRRDRHGAAWADVLGGPRQEVAYVRGGLKGKALRYPVELQQELRTYRSGTYNNLGNLMGLKQKGCSSNAAEWVDIDNDGDLDLFVACNHGQPNRMFVREGKRFEERAAAVGLSDPMDPVVWTDTDRDGDLDMLSVRNGQLYIYENRKGVFRKRDALDVPARGIRQLSLMPLAANTVLVVVAASESGLIEIDPAGAAMWTGLSSLGVPGALLHASWVDHDNDGSMDLYTYPGGLYRRIGAGPFFPADAQPPVPSGPVAQVRVAWFDADEDGKLDFLGGFLEDQRFPLVWKISFARNQTASTNHWLQMDLAGPAGNGSAIGARVEVSTSLGDAATQVDAFESSRHSQGHHRIYLGLGPVSQPVRIEVRWPDGHSDEVEIDRTDRKIEVEHSGGAP